jgi:chemotaxis protein MotA
MIQMTTVIGFLFGVLIIGGSIIMSTDNPIIFYNAMGLAIVLGGVLATVIISNNLWSLLRLVHAVKGIFLMRGVLPQHTAQRYTEYAKIVADEGIIGLESHIENLPHSIERDSMTLLVSGYKKEDIKAYIENSTIEFIGRRTEDANLFRTMAKVAPAYGMIGTVVGLIAMLYNMGDDMSAIGPSMAVALTTTLYGILFATAIFNPFADKITRNMELQLIHYRIVLDGTLMLYDKRNYILIRDALNSHLLPKHRSEHSEDD